MKTLVVYTYNIWNKNCYFFFSKVYNRENITWICVKNDDFKMSDIEFELTNIPDFVIRLKRKNKGYDFGGWAHGINHVNFEDYNFFLFFNSSVMGPILPDYYDGEWLNIFTRLITDDTKLVGSTINCAGTSGFNPELESHVQSFAFCTDKIGLKILISENVFDMQDLGRIRTILEKEIYMSRIMINFGYNIACLQRNLKNINFRCLTTKQILSLPKENIQQNKFFEDYTISPTEILFLKTGWDIKRKFFNLEEQFDFYFLKQLKQTYPEWSDYVEFLHYLVSRFSFLENSSNSLFTVLQLNLLDVNSLIKFKLFMLDSSFTNYNSILRELDGNTIIIGLGHEKFFKTLSLKKYVIGKKLVVTSFNTLVLKTINEDWIKKVNYDSGIPISAYYNLNIR